MEDATKNRFVPIKEMQGLMKQREDIDEKIRSFNPAHCGLCGDTSPEHGFYPLLGRAFGVGIYQTSSLLCNRCARNKEDYEKYFGEQSTRPEQG